VGKCGSVAVNFPAEWANVGWRPRNKVGGLHAVLLPFYRHYAAYFGTDVGLHGVMWSSGFLAKTCGSVRLLIRRYITLISVRLAEGVLDRKGQESTIATYYSQPAHRVLNVWRRRHTTKGFTSTSYPKVAPVTLFTASFYNFPTQCVPIRSKMYYHIHNAHSFAYYLLSALKEFVSGLTRLKLEGKRIKLDLLSHTVSSIL
jgi:hypothetical protein